MDIHPLSHTQTQQHPHFLSHIQSLFLFLKHPHTHTHTLSLSLFLLLTHSLIIRFLLSDLSNITLSLFFRRTRTHTHALCLSLSLSLSRSLSASSHHLTIGVSINLSHLLITFIWHRIANIYSPFSIPV
jgi:hypothetical protein